MEYDNMRVAELRALTRKRRLRGYSRMTKAEIIELIRNNDVPQVISQQGISQREMDIFEEQEIAKSRPQVKSKLNDWYDWLVNHVPNVIRDGATRVFRTFKKRIMGLYDMITSTTYPKARELEQAFNGAYKSYRIDGEPRTDAETFFHRIRRSLIGSSIIYFTHYVFYRLKNIKLQKKKNNPKLQNLLVKQ